MKVIAVFKTHVDIGFTDLPNKILESYSSNMLLKVAEICESTENDEKPFVWTMPAFVLHYALRYCTKQLKLRIERLIREDKIVWHALPLTLRSEFFSGFELRRTLFYAKELCKTYGKPMPISAKMTDVPGHTQAIVDVLAENGIQFLHIGCNPASTPPDVPRLFFWESKKGNRILTYYDKDYGCGVLPPEDWAFPVHLCMTVSGDNMGVQSRETISRLEHVLKSYDPTAEFVTGNMDDFAKELFTCDLSRIPVIAGELGDTWIAGLGAFPEACAAIGNVRGDFEKLSMFLEQKDDNEFAALQQEYFEKTMLFGEHSGGVDVKKYISDIRVYDKAELLAALESESYVYAKRGWDNETQWCLEAQSAVSQLKSLVFEKYGKEALPEEKTLQEESVFDLDVDNTGVIVKSKKNGKSIKIDYLYEVIGRDRIDKYLDGYLTQRVDWSLADFGRYKMDGTNTYPDIGDQTFTPILKEIKRDDARITLRYAVDEVSRIVYGNSEQITVCAAVRGNRAHIRVDVKNKQPTMYAEGGYVCFSIGEALKSIVVCKSGVEIDPEKDIVQGANTALFAAEYVKANGFCIKNVHTPLVCFGEPKIYRNNTDRFRMPQNGKIFFNLFNNMWATGCPQWTSGSYTFEFYISLL